MVKSPSWTGTAVCSIRRCRPAHAGEGLRVEAEEPAEDVLVVLAEARCRRRRWGSDPVEARVGSLLQMRPGHRIIDLDEVAASGHVGVDLHVGGAISESDGHAVGHTHVLHLPRRLLPRPSRRRAR